MDNILINEGIKLHTIHSKKFKTTIVCVLLRRPLAKNEVTKNSLISNILQRGSKKYQTMSKISEETEKMFGSLFDIGVLKKGEEQIFQFYAEFVKTPENTLETILNFIKELMFNPLIENNAFKENYVLIEKNNLKSVIKSRVNNKSEYAKLRCLEEMCSNEAFGIDPDGSYEDVDSLDSKDLYKHYLKILNESPIDIFIIGDEHVEETKDVVKKVFDIKRTNILTIPKTNINHLPEKIKYVKENLEISQGKICVGLRANIEPASKEFYHLLLMNEMLGGSANSKLFLNIREKNSLCYYVKSFIYRFKSIIFIQSAADKENFEKVLDLIEYERNNLEKSNFSKNEFNSSKSSLMKKFISMKDYPSTTANFYLSQSMLEDNDNLEDVLKKIESTTEDEIIEASKKMYSDTIYTLI